MKIYTLTIAAVAVAASQVSSQSTDSYATEATVTLSGQDPNFCVTQHSLVGCGLYSWCEWSSRVRRCHAKADAPPTPVVTPPTLVSSGNAYVNKAHIELQPAKPLPGFCEKQTQQSGCSYFAGCTWEGTACYPIYTEEELAVASTETASVVAAKSTFVAESEPLSVSPTSPIVYGTETLPVCSQQKSQFGCKLLPYCVWVADLCHTIIV